MKIINKKYLAISILEAIYVVYILKYFKTKYSFEYDRSLNILFSIGKLFGLNKKQLNHSMTKTIYPISHICPFGHFISWVIAIYFITRCFSQKIKKYNNLVILIIFMGSFSNINALIYLIPIFIIELIYYCKFKN